jgi:hypothetical protein
MRHMIRYTSNYPIFLALVNRSRYYAEYLAAQSELAEEVSSQISAQPLSDEEDLGDDETDDDEEDDEWCPFSRQEKPVSEILSFPEVMELVLF